MPLFSRKSKAPHLRPCPRCGVEDEKNGVFCFHCGAQILQTAILRPPARRRPPLPGWFRGLASAVGLLVLLGVLFWFFGDRLPVDLVRFSELSVLDGRSMLPRGEVIPRIPVAEKSFKIVGTLALTPRRGRVTVKVFDARETSPRWTRHVDTGFLVHRFVLTLPREGEAPLATGKYKVQLSRGSRVLAGLDFVVE